MQQEPTQLDAVFVVQHEHELPTGEEDVKFIGVYASHAAAEAACERLRQQPGFSETPEGFSIDRYEIGKDHWTEGYVTITHEQLLREYGESP